VHERLRKSYPLIPVAELAVELVGGEMGWSTGHLDATHDSFEAVPFGGGHKQPTNASPLLVIGDREPGYPSNRQCHVATRGQVPVTLTR